MPAQQHAAMIKLVYRIAQAILHDRSHRKKALALTVQNQALLSQRSAWHFGLKPSLCKRLGK